MTMVFLLIIAGTLIFMSIKDFEEDGKSDGELYQLTGDDNQDIAPYLLPHEGPNVSSGYLNPKPNFTEAINQTQIIGKWTAISEETIGRRINFPSQSINYSIELKNNNTYISIVIGDIEEGTYNITLNNIIFYDKKTNLSEPAFGSIENNSLIIIYPEYPKIVAYKRA